MTKKNDVLYPLEKVEAAAFIEDLLSNYTTIDTTCRELLLAILFTDYKLAGKMLKEIQLKLDDSGGVEGACVPMRIRIKGGIKKAEKLLRDVWCKDNTHATLRREKGGWFYFEGCSELEFASAEMLLALEGWN